MARDKNFEVDQPGKFMQAAGIPIYTPVTKRRTDKEKAEAMKIIEAKKERDLELITVQYRKLINGYDTVAFTQRKYKGEPPMKYSMKDGETYVVPRYVMDYINNEAFEQEYAYVDDRNSTVPVLRQTGGKRQRFMLVRV